MGGLRVGELVASSQRDSSDRPLRVDDVSLHPDLALIHLRYSKTDQKERGCTISLQSCSDRDLCPIISLQSYLDVRGPAEGALFQQQDGSPLTRFQLSAVTRRALDRLGLRDFHFSTHSFRIRAASKAAFLRYSSQDIQWVGRWKSGCFRNYVHRFKF